MARLRNKAKVPRPRFTVRSLFVLLTLACVYLSLWSVTRSRGVLDIERRFAFIGSPASSPAPLIVGINDEVQSGWYATEVRTYYVWMFGYTLKLPLERKVGQPSRRSYRPAAEFVIPLPDSEIRRGSMEDFRISELDCGGDS